MERGLLREHEYDAERAERARAGGHQSRGGLSRGGVSRRGLLRAGLAGLGVAAVGGGAVTSPAALRTARAVAADTPIAKPLPPELFTIRGTNAEMRWEAMQGQGYLTPIDRFFIRNHTTTPRIDATTWRLRIHGSGVERELSVSLADLQALPQVTVTRAVECAGNARSLFASQQGTPASGTAWGLGAIGVATWTGVRLSEVLERAGLKPTALDVMPVGLDSMQVRRPIPVEKALADTLLVTQMNGVPLPLDHGYPVRLLAPGWVGVANVKWVGSIEVSETPLYSQWNTTSYRLFGPDHPDTPLVTTQVVKSALELPFPATLAPGAQRLTGRSWSGLGRISRVDVSVDGGPWRAAVLEKRNEDLAWRQWSFPWNAKRGEHTVSVRARDDQGNVQPETVPFNEQGYLFGAIVDHPVSVG